MSGDKTLGQRLRVGVVGAGTMGRNHVRVYSMLRDADLVGLVDPARSARDEVAHAYGVAAFDELDELLPQVDAVSVVVPTELHVDVATQCLRRGVHVLVEKPIATTSKEAERLIDQARESGRVLQVGHVERFNPAVLELPKLIAGERLLAIAAQRFSPPTPRITDVDVVFDLMIHDVDIVLSLLQSSLVRLGAVGRPVTDGPLDHVVAHAVAESGVIVSLAASKVTQDTVRRLEVTTDRSYILVNYLNRDVTVHRRAVVIERPERADVYMENITVSRPHVPSVEPLRLELEHFLSCVRSGDEPRTSGAQALEALRVAERIRDATRAPHTAAYSGRTYGKN